MESSRSAGILLPVSSLPSPYGVGSLGKAAYSFIDFLKKAGQKYWQVLPIGPTGFGDSPYQSFSAFAGNPYFIDLDFLAEEGLLKPDEIIDSKDNDEFVNYGRLYKERFLVLRKASLRFNKDTDEFKAFNEENSSWLEDYALYMALKNHFGQKDMQYWDRVARMRDPQTIEMYKSLLKNEIDFWKFCQYEFYKQWMALKEYANKKGIEIIGDIPIYVSGDSADVFANPQLFLLDKERRPTWVAGVPPDYFSETGQLWGNPIYDWKAMEEDDFRWWKMRIRSCAKLYDVIRIDHFIGIARYYAIKAGSENAVKGRWRIGPDIKLINAINEAKGKVKIIAEDLGVLHPRVEKLLKRSGYPGMKVLLFAAENTAENNHILYKHGKNSIVYVGTHDNDTARGFCDRESEENLRFLIDYFSVSNKEELPKALIKGAYASAADTVIIQMQDWLLKDNSARMNVPSTIGCNWRWRVQAKDLTDKLAFDIRKTSEIYGRINE
ncbi:4-alpha-glucanotransferase [Clostridium polynesiense]|uniref:4-alpha-glucanotransferase n=1 Tax=Clostridium polynesiense TaxID=1325933 RepID=UPI00058D283B|nr:4-alpha-glucanotransferase [Clostridium polynesiense]